MEKSAPLRVNNICKSFDAKEVLKSLSFSLEEGEIFGLIGLNGIGKTTLIKIILDLLTPDSGEASLFGQPSSNVASRRNLSYLPEKFQPSRYLKGHEYLALSLSFFGKTYDPLQAHLSSARLTIPCRRSGRRRRSISTPRRWISWWARTPKAWGKSWDCWARLWWKPPC